MHNRRKVLRHLFGVDAKLSESGNPAVLDVRVVNLSTEGCCAETPGTLKVGGKHVLIIGWRAKEILAEVVVVWTDTQGRAGLRFHSVRQEDQATLRELCSTLEILPALRPPHRAA